MRSVRRLTWHAGSIRHGQATVWSTGQTRLNVANTAAHRALADARLVQDMFWEVLRRTPTLKTIADLVRVLPLLTFADAPVCTIAPPAGFEALSTAITTRCAITSVYEHGGQRPVVSLNSVYEYE